MTEYYVSGVIEIEGTCGRVTDEDAEFFTLYGKDDQGLSQCIADFTDRLSAEAAMQVYQERDALQQQVNALAAENLALKTGVTYFACGSEYGFDLFRDKQAAIDVCLEEIDLHREGYLDGDGWDDNVGKTAWGIVIQSAQGRDAQGINESETGHTYQTCNYRLEDEVKTPATEAITRQWMKIGAGRVARRASELYRDSPIGGEDRHLYKNLNRLARQVATQLRQPEEKGQ